MQNNETDKGVGDESDPSSTPHMESGPIRKAVSITRLAELPAQTLLDERAVAEVFAVTARTIRRMVARFELPPPIRMAGRSTWIAGRILEHVNERAKRAALKADQMETRVKRSAGIT